MKHLSSLAEHCARHCTFLFSVIYHLIRKVKLAGMRQSQQCKNTITGIMLTKGHAVQQMGWLFWGETAGRSHGRAESCWALKDGSGKDILWSGTQAMWGRGWLCVWEQDCEPTSLQNQNEQDSSQLTDPRLWRLERELDSGFLHP